MRPADLLARCPRPPPPVSIRRTDRQSGQAVVLIVVMLAVLLGAAALTIDVGYAYYTHRSLQADADAAALAGAVRWKVGSLGLQPGHSYRMQFMVHDGDQHSTGGDVGEACMHDVIPAELTSGHGLGVDTGAG